MRAASAAATAPLEDVDHWVTLRDVSWPTFLAVLAARGESNALRITYVGGDLELMSPSRSRETIKKTIARLVEAYAEERGIELNGFGSWTLKSKPKRIGVEPDECYSIGVPGRVPDLAIGVVWTSGGLDKLDAYRGLGVREVWVWQKGKLAPYVLRGDRYVRAARSRLLPELDLALVARFADQPSQLAAVRGLRALLRRS